jgi:hypothetical protein
MPNLRFEIEEPGGWGSISVRLEPAFEISD